MISIIDYGMGNLRSVQKGFEKVGHQAVVTSDPAEVAPQLETEGEITEESPPEATNTNDPEIQIPTECGEFTPSRDFG